MVHEDDVDLAVMKARRVDGLSEQPGGLLACAVWRLLVPRPLRAGGCAGEGTVLEGGLLQWASWQLAPTHRGSPLQAAAARQAIGLAQYVTLVLKASPCSLIRRWAGAGGMG